MSVPVPGNEGSFKLKVIAKSDELKRISGRFCIFLIFKVLCMFDRCFHLFSYTVRAHL